MVCRTTQVGSAVTSYIIQSTDLEEQQVLSLYHEVMREGRSADAPTSIEQYRAINNIRSAIVSQSNMTDARGRSILTRLNRAQEEEMTGQRYYATTRLQERAQRAQNALETFYANTARTMGTTEADVRSQMAELRTHAGTDRRIRADREFVEGLGSNTNYPLDRQTAYAMEQMTARMAERSTTAPSRPAVTRTPVDSSAIAEMGYDATTGRCEVVMRSNPEVPYAYHMTPDEYRDFSRAPSLGSYYARNIRSNPSYRYSDTEEQNADSTVNQCASCGQFAGSGHACPPHGSQEEIGRTVRRARQAARTAARRHNPTVTTVNAVEETPEPVRVAGQSRPYYGASGMFRSTALGSVQRFTRSSRTPALINVGSFINHVASEEYEDGRARVTSGTVSGDMIVTYNGHGQGYTATAVSRSESNNHLRCNCSQYRATYDCMHIRQTINDVNTRINQDQLRERHSIGTVTNQVNAELAVDHEESVTAQQTAREEDTPSSVSYTDDVAAFQADYNAAKARAEAGENPVPYMTENATGGLGARGTGRAFGIELEFDLDSASNRYTALANIGRELHEAGLTRSSEQTYYHAASNRGYTENHQGGWSFEEDCTVSGEIVSPIMYDTPETWENIAKVCEIVKRNGGQVTTRTGSHVHVSTHNYNHTVENHNRLMGSFAENEDTIYRLSSNPERGTHRGPQWCAPNTVPSGGYRSVQDVRYGNGGHHLGINLQSVNGRSSDHVEFRTFDASLDPSVIQTQIKMSLGITESAFRDTDYQPGEHTPLGSHRTNNRRDHGATRRLTGEAWQQDTAGYRAFADRIFRRPEDKAQLTSLFAVTKWQRR